jgi:transposase, IS30 family
VAGRTPVSRVVQRRFWVLVRDGCSAEAAALAVGVSVRTGWSWFSQSGGMAPMKLSEPPAPGAPGVRPPRLTLAEREEIAIWHAQKVGVNEIGRRLGRHGSTISREIHRNSQRARRDRYRATSAQAQTETRARRPKPAKLATNPRLHDEVQDRLRLNHSPEQIARRLVEDFPGEAEMWVSHETIYQSLYVQGRGALRRELTRHLRTGRTLRKPRRRVEARGVRQVSAELMISARPAEVADRAVPGHWEGDLIIGQDSGSAIGTLVERVTGFVLLLHLPGNHGALTVQYAMIEKMAKLPDTLRRTLTWDQGSEMANHARIADATQLAIYFCDPHSPWQRGSNENTNGLLRQYFPKSTDLSVHGPGFLDYVAAEMNNRPRKRLAWRTPAEALDALLCDPSKPPGVALTA